MSTQRGRILITGFDVETVEELDERLHTGETEDAADVDVAELEIPEPESRTRQAWRRFKRNRGALIGSALILFMAFLTVFSRPLSVPEFVPVLQGMTVQPFSLAPHPPDLHDYSATSEAPSLVHPFGTDWAGRDIFSRVLYGGRWSLTIGFIAVGLALLIGVPAGAVAGYYGGWIDEVIMRLVDILYAFPFLILALAVVAIVGRGFWELIFALVVVGWISYARLIRGEILSVKENEYVLAAKAVGVRNHTIMFRHIVPNAMAPVIVQATLGIGTIVLAAAGLGFLGLGLEPGSAEWGSMLSRGRDTLIQGQWWVTVFPGMAIFLFVMAINLVGDGIRDAFDPHEDAGDEEHRGGGI